MQLTYIGNPFVFFTMIGFLAQLVDGAIGMAYGVLSTTLLIFLGVSPLHASASVKAAELVTTGVSGAAHQLVGNVERRWLWNSISVNGSGTRRDRVVIG